MVAIQNIKEVLFEDLDKLVYILEELGCHKINPSFSFEELRCALPYGDNATSVCIKKVETLPCYVYSSTEYESFEIKDIITFTHFIRKTGFFDSIKWLCGKLGIKIEDEDQESFTFNILNELRKIKRLSAKKEDITHEIIDEKELNRFKKEHNLDWIKEGISKKTQDKFGIRKDEFGKRWIIPIYDINNNLISIKARTYIQNFEEKGLSKYIYYHKLKQNDILYGLNMHFESIKDHDEIILFEAEKSVMISDELGYDWSASLSTSKITSILLPKILELKVSNCVIALDKGIKYKDVLKTAKKISKYMNTYIVYDKYNLLDEEKKQSPVDCGKETWEILYKNRIRVQ